MSISWKERRGQIKHLLYEMCLTGRIDKETFCEQLADLNRVEPVVYCKDCKYYNEERLGEKMCEYSFDFIPRESDDFCSRGERKDEVEE